MDPHGMDPLDSSCSEDRDGFILSSYHVLQSDPSGQGRAAVCGEFLDHGQQGDDEEEDDDEDEDEEEDEEEGCHARAMTMHAAHMAGRTDEARCNDDDDDDDDEDEIFSNLTTRHFGSADDERIAQLRAQGKEHREIGRSDAGDALLQTDHSSNDSLHNKQANLMSLQPSGEMLTPSTQVSFGELNSTLEHEHHAFLNSSEVWSGQGSAPEVRNSLSWHMRGGEGVQGAQRQSVDGQLSHPCSPEGWNQNGATATAGLGHKDALQQQQQQHGQRPNLLGDGEWHFVQDSQHAADQQHSILQWGSERGHVTSTFPSQPVQPGQPALVPGLGKPLMDQGEQTWGRKGQLLHLANERSEQPFPIQGVVEPSPWDAIVEQGRPAPSIGPWTEPIGDVFTNETDIQAPVRLAYHMANPHNTPHPSTSSTNTYQDLGTPSTSTWHLNNHLPTSPSPRSTPHPKCTTNFFHHQPHQQTCPQEFVPFTNQGLNQGPSGLGSSGLHYHGGTNVKSDFAVSGKKPRGRGRRGAMTGGPGIVDIPKQMSSLDQVRQQSHPYPIKEHKKIVRDVYSSSSTNVHTLKASHIVSWYIDYLIHENEHLTQISRAFSLPVNLFHSDDFYFMDSLKKNVHFPSIKFLSWMQQNLPSINVNAVDFHEGRPPRPLSASSAAGQSGPWGNGAQDWEWQNKSRQDIIHDVFFYFQHLRVTCEN